MENAKVLLDEAIEPAPVRIPKNKKKIALANPIKALGTFEVELKLLEGISTKINFVVEGAE